jgi:hypothetical protein
MNPPKKCINLTPAKEKDTPMPIDKNNMLQAAFLRQIGDNANVAAFLFLLDMLPDTAAYLKDRQGRSFSQPVELCELQRQNRFGGDRKTATTFSPIVRSGLCGPDNR